MFIRVQALVATWLAVTVLGCSTKAPREPLPRLEAPADLTYRDEPLYLRAHLEQFFRSTEVGDDMNFDYWTHVTHQQTFIILDLHQWDKMERVGRDWLNYDIKQAYLARTPEALRFHGARERAVALALLAMSIWRQRPPGGPRPTMEQLQACERVGKPCHLSPRTLVLQRMILMGMYAHRELFEELTRRRDPPGTSSSGPLLHDHRDPT